MDIVIDLETYDPYLTTRGTDAHARRWGGYVFMCGLYFPADDRVAIMPWDDEAKAVVGALMEKGNTWYGANIKYDLGWLLSDKVVEPIHSRINNFEDTHINEPMIDETQPPNHYHLDAMCSKYGYQTKPIDKLLAAAEAAGIKTDAKKVRGELHRLPWDVVAEYNEHDLRATWHVIQAQKKLISELRLDVVHNDMPISVHELECKLIPVLAMMEHQGVKVDVDAAQKLHDQIYVHIEEIKERLRQANNGTEVPLSASNALTQFLRDRGHDLPYTPASTPEKPRYGTDANTLLSLATKDPVVGDIVIARRAEKIAKDFCKGAILDTHHNGRIYPNINQMIAYKEGTSDGSKGVRFGRLSYSGPNLQQIPKRDKVGFDETGGLGTAMRRLFPAEDGCQYMSGDFSGQEPRGIIHWAETWNIPGAAKYGDKYRANPRTSNHEMVAEVLGCTKDEAKPINLGKGYEMGYAKLIAGLVAIGKTEAEAKAMLDLFEEEFSYISGASRAAMAAADKLGYVRTIFGRRLQFNLWEPTAFKGAALPYDEAYQKYVLAKAGRSAIKRAFTYRAFNRIVQGSAADQTKYAMVVLWYTYGILATMQVHDELTDAYSTPERAVTFKVVMETCVTLTVPSLTDIKVGPNWAEGVKV